MDRHLVRRYGRIFDIAVHPYAEVRIEGYAFHNQKAPIAIRAENFDERYAIGRKQNRYACRPLLEAAIKLRYKKLNNA